MDSFRKTIPCYTIILILFSLIQPIVYTSTPDHLVINEFDQNPPGNDNYLTVEEWVELYNPASEAVDIGGWTLSTTSGSTVTVSIPGGTIIGAKSFYVFSRGSRWLDNDAEAIILRDTNSNEVDRTPASSDDDNDGWSWARYPNGQDTDSDIDWRFQASTIGTTNGGESSPPEPEPESTRELALFAGWNLISLPLTPEDPSIGVVLTDILDSVNSVWTFDGETKTWSSYSPGAPSALSEMVDDRGYWIRMTEDATLTVRGESADTRELALFEDWNLISLPLTPEDPSIEVVLADILDDVNSVWTFDGETKTWSSYSPGAPSNLNEMIEDKGYWIKVNTDCILTLYPRARDVRIGALNIQIFGKAKREKVDVMEVLTKITLEFDILFVQEIRDASGETAPYFLQLINEAGNSTYEYIRSERLGRTSSKETYAYFYNNETVDFIEGSDYIFNDTNDFFEREPYIASFRSGEFDFILVGIHVKPHDAYNEIGNLSLVVHSILETQPNEEDIIVLGDLNADGSYYFEEDTTNPFKAPNFFWVITNEMDTMVKTHWTYDRIVMLNTTYRHEYVDDSARVFYYDVEYGIDDMEFIGKVSDHYPIYADFRTDLVDDD